MDEITNDNGSSLLSSRPVVLLGWVAMAVFAFHACTHMVGAGDTWVAMACGRHFINHGVDTVEPFSANSHKAGPTEEDIKNWPPAARWIADKVGIKTVRYWHPTGWINQNWLTHVIFYWLSHESPIADADSRSFDTLVYWKFAVYALTIICVYYTGRLLGVNALLSAAFACLAMFTGRSFFDIRPAGFSNLMVAVFLLILVLTTYRNILYIWLIVPLSVLWCNLHGGYLYLFIMLVSFTSLNFISLFFPKRFVTIGGKGIYHTIAAGFAALIASIVFNPFHLTNFTHTFVISFSKHAKMWRTVNEWHPAFEWKNPVGTGFPFLVVLILSSGLLAFYFFSRLISPRLFKAPKKELEAQSRLHRTTSRLFGFITAVFSGWVIFIGFSLLNLSAVDFLLCALFIGILLLGVYRSVYFICLSIPLVLAAMWACGSQSDYVGRYIYPFVLLPCYVTTGIVSSLFSKTVKIERKNIVFVAAAAVVCLIMMIVLFNPFRFESSVWHLSQLLHLKRPWMPKYELMGNVYLNYKFLFPVLYIVNAVSIIIWMSTSYFKTAFSKLAELFESAPETSVQDSYKLPRIDLSLLVIAGLTVYMAIRSRRFIPIAAIAACPVMAMLIMQTVRTMSASANFHKYNRFVFSAVGRNLEMFFVIAGVVIVAGLGSWWALKFKQVYLDPWPTDSRLNSVFMRMTASSVKPFYACQFITDNKLSGNMFNYWTEGGFIAWSQPPDPCSGRTPLQLFMDGRAQAAYEPRVYRRWSEILYGGPVRRKAAIRKQKLTPADYVKIGKWVDNELKSHNVWLVMMPSNVFNKPSIKGLAYNPTWPVVFLNDKQKIFVDMTTQKGKKLLEGILNGETVYPDEFSKKLVFARNTFIFENNRTGREKALDFAIEAFKLNPSVTPAQEVMFGAKFAELRPKITAFCEDYLRQFEQNKTRWFAEDGYNNKIAAAIITASYLRELAIGQNKEALVKYYTAEIQRLKQERMRTLKSKRW